MYDTWQFFYYFIISLLEILKRSTIGNSLNAYKDDILEDILEGRIMTINRAKDKDKEHSFMLHKVNGYRNKISESESDGAVQNNVKKQNW